MYKKTAIRNFFTAYLKTEIPALSTRIFSGRIDPLQKDSNIYPYLIVFSKDENITADFTSYTEREFELKIGVVVSENQTADSDFDSIIEATMYEVEKAMSKVVSIEKLITENYRLFNEIAYSGSQMDSDISSGKDMGMAMMTYNIIYEYEKPVDPLVLADFDITASLQNLTITNPGVPA